MRLFFITSNIHKFLEIKEIFSSEKMDLKLTMTNLRKIEIQDEDLVKIVKFATEHLLSNGYDNFFIEDSGLFIRALNNFPGPFSSYVYKTIGNSGILRLMQDIDDRSAYFKSVIALCYNGKIKMFEGIVNGTISREIKGNKGFGFDPIFIPRGYSKTFGEMERFEKNKISHRAKAAREMIKYLKQLLSST